MVGAEGEVAAGEVCAEMQFRSTFPLLCAAASGGRCVLGGGGGTSKTGVPNGMRLLRHKSPRPRFVLLVHFILSWYTLYFHGTLHTSPHATTPYLAHSIPQFIPHSTPHVSPPS